jgi:predicted RNase H-like HicB family nuclease
LKTYHVYIETSQDALDEGGPLAHVPELPGCTARGKTVEAARDSIRQSAQDYVAFLRAQGERDLPDEFELEFEEVSGYTLPPDYVPMAPDEIARARRWLEASRGAVLAEINDLPTEAWDWKPAPGEWSLRWITNHMGGAELYLTDKLMEPERALLDRLAVTRRAALERLDALAAGNTGSVTTFEGEEWTLRKVLRRMLEHEQEHLSQIRDLVVQFKSSH